MIYNIYEIYNFFMMIPFYEISSYIYFYGYICQQRVPNVTFYEIILIQSMWRSLCKIVNKRKLKVSVELFMK